MESQLILGKLTIKICCGVATEASLQGVPDDLIQNGGSPGHTVFTYLFNVNVMLHPLQDSSGLTMWIVSSSISHWVHIERQTLWTSLECWGGKFSGLVDEAIIQLPDISWCT